MNLSDIKKQAIELEEKMHNFSEIINSLTEVVKPVNENIGSIYEVLINRPIAGNSTEANNNATQMKNTTISIYDVFLQSLRKIYFAEVYLTIPSLENKYEYFGVNDYIKIFKDTVKQIHTFNSQISREKMGPECINVINMINRLWAKHNDILTNINQVKKICDTLIGPETENSLKIRLLSENKEFSTLIQNLYLIESIYNNIGELMGESDSALQYRRLESGTIEIDLTGAINTLSALIPILTFAYKIYSENFSYKAKQDKKMGDIKVRMEYVKYIRDVKELDYSGPSVQDLLGKIENDIRKLYSQNPCIEVNNQRLGIEEMKNQTLDPKLLESVITDGQITD